MYTYVVGTSRNGRRIYTNIINSVAGRYFSRQPHLVHMARDILEPLRLSGPLVTISRDLGHVIGNTNIVVTEEKDTIFYARPPKQSNMLRFVKNRSMAPSSELVMVLCRDSNGDYELANVWIGPQCPPFPDARDASRESVAYWRTHALTVGSELIDPQTITAAYPY